MWKSLKYRHLEDENRALRAKIEDFEELKRRVVAGKSFLIDDEVFMISQKDLRDIYDTMVDFKSNEMIRQLQEKIQKLEIERDFLKYQYAYERCREEMESLEIDRQTYSEAFRGFLEYRRNQDKGDSLENTNEE